MQEQGEPFSSLYREKDKFFKLTDPRSHCYNQYLADRLIESLILLETYVESRQIQEA